MIRRLTAALVVALTLTVAPVGAAHALSNPLDRLSELFDGADCRTPPPTQAPSNNIASGVDPGPDNPRPGNPFGVDATTTVYEKYLYGGLAWTAYDSGCLVDKTGLPAETVSYLTPVANFFVQIAALEVALANVTTRLAREPQPLLAAFDPAVLDATRIFGETVFNPLIGIVLLAAGVAIAYTAMRGNLSASAGKVAGAVLVTAAGLFIIDYPSRAVGLFDDMAISVITAVDEGMAGSSPADPGVASAANLHDNLLYTTWKGGAFGRPDSPCSERFADDLFEASTLSLQEYQTVLSDPDGAGAALKEQKRQDWQDIADEVEATDEDCYQHLKGTAHSGGTRLAYAVPAALLTGPALAVTQTIANVVFIVALLVMRFVIALAPVLAVAAVLRPALLYGPFLSSAGLLGRGILLAVGMQVFVSLAGGLLAAVNPIVAGIIVAFAAIALLVAKPWKKKMTDPRAWMKQKGKWIAEKALDRQLWEGATEDAIRDDRERQQRDEERSGGSTAEPVTEPAAETTTAGAAGGGTAAQPVDPARFSITAGPMGDSHHPEPEATPAQDKTPPQPERDPATGAVIVTPTAADPDRRGLPAPAEPKHRRGDEPALQPRVLAPGEQLPPDLIDLGDAPAYRPARTSAPISTSSEPTDA